MNANDSAFPIPHGGVPGLTKREAIAALALAGLLADHVTRQDAIKFAVVAADGLIEELNGNGATP